MVSVGKGGGVSKELWQWAERRRGGGKDMYLYVYVYLHLQIYTYGIYATHAHMITVINIIGTAEWSRGKAIRGLEIGVFNAVIVKHGVGEEVLLRQLGVLRQQAQQTSDLQGKEETLLARQEKT